jgi:AcrR family transcriptional regulator
MAATAISDFGSQIDEMPVEGPSACVETLDPRIRRTRELLQQALANLLDSRDFERISVQDIAEAATVNRATFYAHYTDKFALLECMVGSRFQALLAARNVVFDGTCSGALHGMVLGVCDYLAQTLSQPEPTRRLEPHLESAIIAVVRRMLQHGLESHRPPAGPSPGLLASTASWAIFGAAREWVYTPDRLPSEEIAPVIVALVTPILSVAPPPRAGSVPALA